MQLAACMAAVFGRGERRERAEPVAAVAVAEAVVEAVAEAVAVVDVCRCGMR